MAKVVERDEFEDALAVHASDIRRLFGLLCQVYSGGKGIDEIGQALVDANCSFQELCQKIEEKRSAHDEWWKAQQRSINQITASLSIGERPTFPAASSFASLEIPITMQAAKVVAHILLDHPGRGSKASMALMDTVLEVGEYHMSNRRGRGR